MLALMIAVPALALIGLMTYLSVKDGDLAEVTVTDSYVVVNPRRMNVVWALRKRVEVPLHAIRSVEVGVPRSQVPGGIRLPGTFLPGVIKAGTFRSRGSKSFWLVGRAEYVTVIECPGHTFDRVVLEASPDANRALSSIVVD